MLLVSAATGKFTQGSVTGHIVVMTLTSTAGLVAVFLVDLVDMFFLSLLGQEALAASVGFAGTLLFFMTAVAIGCQIGVGALIARAEGAKNRKLASRYFGHSLWFGVVFSVLLSVLAYTFKTPLLQALGASGQTLFYADQYVSIVLPSSLLLVTGLSICAALRALGDPRHSMYAILASAIANAVLDPLFIFGLNLGVQGAALAAVCSRVVLCVLAYRAITRRHRVRWQTSGSFLRLDSSVWAKVSVPAVFTNLATPLGSAIVMRAMADFGVEAVAGMAIVGRVVPVAFALLFALSGAIGPVIGQNVGAHKYNRARKAMRVALWVSVAYVLLMWLCLALFNSQLLALFAASGQTAELITFYNRLLVGGFVFSAMLFVGNACFNFLGKALWSTLFNFSRSLLGILPACMILAPLYGAHGVMVAEVLGPVLFGLASFGLAYRLIGQMERSHSHTVETAPPLEAMPGYGSAQSQVAAQCMAGNEERNNDN